VSKEAPRWGKTRLHQPSRAAAGVPPVSLSTKGRTLSGNHAAGHRVASRRHPNLIPALVGAVVAAVLVGAAVASLGLGSGGSKPTAVSVALPSASPSDNRSPDDRADRGELRVGPTPPTNPSAPPTYGPPSPSTRPSHSPSTRPSKSAPTGTESGGTCGVSYYQDGSKTASGEKFDPNGLTAAHRSLPFNTMVRVTNPANGKSVTVRINDRGPFVSSRCLDLARGAFLQISTVSAGVIPHAKYEVLK
jgi:rare lipoprotein A